MNEKFLIKQADYNRKYAKVEKATELENGLKAYKLHMEDVQKKLSTLVAQDSLITIDNFEKTLTPYYEQL